MKSRPGRSARRLAADRPGDRSARSRAIGHCNRYSPTTISAPRPISKSVCTRPSIIEPKDTRWSDSETGGRLGDRLAQAIAPGGPSTRDGGPTSWQALIVPENARRAAEGFREFVLEFQDSQLAYQAGSVPQLSPYTPYAGPTTPATYKGWTDPRTPSCRPGDYARRECPEHYHRRRTGCPHGQLPQRADSLPGRRDPGTPDPGADESATDLAHVFRSIERSRPGHEQAAERSDRAGSPFNFPQAFTDAQPFDPFTPLLRAYENDRVQIRVLVGAHHEPHVFNLQGLKWQTEPTGCPIPVFGPTR